jgi:uncharacterized protein DUF5681
LAKSSTTWTKGQSGNPTGRRKEVGPVRELAKQYTEAAIDTLAKVMQDENAPHSARVAAAEALLARGWGKPQQIIDMSLEHSMELPKPDLLDIWSRRRKPRGLAGCGPLGRYLAATGLHRSL